jgi:hypothetical protein
MAVSALVMAATGVAGSFVPQRAAARDRCAAHGPLPVAVQLYGAMLLGFAVVNWLAKDSLIGGIYNRPWPSERPPTGEAG